MRTLIVNANIVTGDGKTILENRSIIIEGELIESIRTDPCPIYDPASRAVDAKGGWVIPGLIDHHTHMITRGPYPADYALPGLPKARVRSRIVMSPLHAKAFAMALTDNLSKFEKRFGEIQTAQEDWLKDFGFQGPGDKLPN